MEMEMEKEKVKAKASVTKSARLTESISKASSLSGRSDV